MGHSSLLRYLGGTFILPRPDYNKNRMKRANIKILALILSLIVLPPLMWELKSQVGVVPGGSGGVPDNAVQGASNLTTAGAIPYVSSSGTLNQDANQLMWDSSQNSLGVRSTAAAGYALTVGGSVTVSAGALIRNDTYKQSGASTHLSIANDNVSSSWQSILINPGASGSVGIGPSNTSPTGTLHVYDATATTGSTLVTIARGDAQTASSTVLTMNGVAQFSGTNTTGAGSAALGSNSPAVTNSAPYTWIQVVTSDGSTAYIPAWK